MNSKDVIHESIPLDGLLREILVTINKMGRNASTDPRQMPFASNKFKAKTLHDAIEEAKGFVYGQLDPGNFTYKHGMSIRDVLDKVVRIDATQLNEKILDLLPEQIRPEKSATGVNDCLQTLLKILVRQAEQTRLLEEKIDELQDTITNHINNITPESTVN